MVALHTSSNLSLLYYFPAQVICYTGQGEFYLNPTAQYCFYKGYLNKKLILNNSYFTHNKVSYFVYFCIAKGSSSKGNQIS